jgi:hypothetical protein
MEAFAHFLLQAERVDRVEDYGGLYTLFLDVQ